MSDHDPHDPAHDRLRTDLGAYVLGGLGPADAAAVEAHLRGCAACRAERDALLPAASVLGELRRADVPGTADDVHAPAGLEPALLARLAEESRQERRTSWARRAGVAAVAGAAAAAVLVAGLVLTRPDDAPPAVPTEAVEVSVRDAGVAADAELVNHTWGVEVRLSGSGFAAGGRYRVDVLGADGSRFPAGEFVGTGSAEMVCNLNSSVLRDQASGFEVRARDGHVVLRSSFDA
ncbi:hypothetical protein GCM10023340_37490 [Nocardioides marinquilinus]|uniref:Putative zinc-finger domain-containing protein n=1 Tax=Nocardioides marinquilinus TaxID=1210400 RepID=A0ABP9PYF1_9ACTN